LPFVGSHTVMLCGQSTICRQEGSTYLELLVTAALLGGAATAYVATFDGVEEQAARAQTAHTLSSVEHAVRIHHVVMKTYPDHLDGLLAAPTMINDATTAREGGFDSHLPKELQGEDGHEQTADGLLAFHRLSPAEVAALTAAGITGLRMIRTDRNNDDRSSHSDPPGLEDPPRGVGLEVPLQPGLTVAAIGCVAFPNGVAKKCSSIGALDPTISHLVVAFGLGRHSSLIPRFLAEAPVSPLSSRDRYRRYLALYHLASDDGTGSGIPGNGRFEDGEVFQRARLVSIIDPSGYTREEAMTVISLQSPQP
jgi:hypothetical protein